MSCRHRRRPVLVRLRSRGSWEGSAAHASDCRACLVYGARCFVPPPRGVPQETQSGSTRSPPACAKKVDGYPDSQTERRPDRPEVSNARQDPDHERRNTTSRYVVRWPRKSRRTCASSGIGTSGWSPGSMGRSATNRSSSARVVAAYARSVRSDNSSTVRRPAVEWWFRTLATRSRSASEALSAGRAGSSGSGGHSRTPPAAVGCGKAVCLGDSCG